MNDYKDRLQNKEKYLNKRREFIENEIHVQIEALKEHLDALEAEMKESLAESTQNMVRNLEKFEKANGPRLGDMKIALENLKANSVLNGSDSARKLNPKLNMVMQHQTVNSCVENLTELTKINRSMSEMISELKFEPNIDFPSASAIIGELMEVKDANLKEHFKAVKSHVGFFCLNLCEIIKTN